MALDYSHPPGFSAGLNKGEARMKTVIAALSVLAAGTGASVGSALALEEPGRALVASDTVLQISNDPELTGEAGNSVQRSFIPPYSGIVRVTWEVRSVDGTPVSSSAQVIHVDSCQRPTGSTAFVTKVCNIRVAGGMPITITAQPSTGDTVPSLRNVRLYYRVINAKGVAINYDVPDD
jgi:hypothetical protein